MKLTRGFLVQWLQHIYIIAEVVGGRGLLGEREREEEREGRDDKVREVCEGEGWAGTGGLRGETQNMISTIEYNFFSKGRMGRGQKKKPANATP